MVKDTIFPGYVEFNYAPWVTAPDPGKESFPYRAPKDGGRYEPGNVSYVAYAGEYEALKRILEAGVENIYAHTKPLCDRLKKELPALGYKLITPLEAKSSLVVVQARDLNATRKKLERANIQVTTTGQNRVRISPALYNNQQDVDKLLSALA